MNLIKSIDISNKNPEQGESIKISVNTQDQTHIKVFIDGIQGHTHYMQVNDIGIQNISVFAHSPSRESEYETISINVKKSSVLNPPILELIQDISERRKIDLNILNWEKTKLNGQNHIFHWNFDDGNIITTKTPNISYTYDYPLNADIEFVNRNIELIIKDKDNNKELHKIKTTICFHNEYYLLKYRKNLYALECNNILVKREQNYWKFNLSLKNPHNGEINFNKLYCRTSNFIEDSHKSTILDISINAKSFGDTSNITFNIEDTDLLHTPSEIDLFSLHFEGLTMQSNKRAVLDAYIEAKLITSTTKLISSSTPIYKNIKKLYKEGKISLDEPIDNTLLTKKDGDNKVSENTKNLVQDIDIPRRINIPNLHNELPDINIPIDNNNIANQICDPDRDFEKDGYTCLPDPTSDEIYIYEKPAYIQNALKGDIILSPGGDSGFIGGLLSQLEESQLYSHTGIMSKSFKELTHSTASEDWIIDQFKQKLNGVNVIKDITDSNSQSVIFGEELLYIWPGLVTQKVGDAFGIPDEDTRTYNNKEYKIKSFSYKKKHIITPLVIAPERKYEDSLRDGVLSAIADYSKTINTYYNFYTYSKSDIVNQSSNIAPSSSWAAGKKPTCCSSFIWYCIKTLPRYKEIILEDNPKTIDGLYSYSIEDRKNAAEWLFEKTKTKILRLAQDILRNKLSLDFLSIENVISPIATNIANQVCNAFAFNTIDTDDGWKNPNEGIAVSCDDMLKWDSYQENTQYHGLYGYSEGMRFREKQYIITKKIWRWKKARTGKVTVEVKNSNDQLLENVFIELYLGSELKEKSFTNPYGVVVFDRVIEGSYFIQASYTDANYTTWEWKKLVDISPHTDNKINIKLTEKLLPRQLNIAGEVYISERDYIGGVIADHEEGTISLDNTYEISSEDDDIIPIDSSEIGGNEIKVEIDFDATVRDDYSIKFDYAFILKEGTSIATATEKGREPRSGYKTIYINRGTQKDINKKVKYTRRDGSNSGDYAILNLTISNKDTL